MQHLRPVTLGKKNMDLVVVCFAYVFLTMIFFGCVLWTGVLFVSVGRSSMSTLRMEPQFMMIGHAAGTVASLAITSELKQGIQKIDVDLLHVLLLKQGMVLEF